MLSVFIIAVLGSVFISAFCSLMEAALYAVPIAHAKSLAENGSKSGRLLLRFKEDMAAPVAAILILNTLSNTFGASIAGWAAGVVFGSKYLAFFSAAFTLTILYLSEILPKTIGVIYSKQVAGYIAYPLSILILLLKPFICISQWLSKFIRRETGEPSVSHEEMLSLAAIGTEEGSLDRLEGSVISNVIGLDKLLVRDILTPRVVVFRLDEETQISELKEEIANWNFSRIPLFNSSEPDHLNAYVTQRDIYRELLSDSVEIKLKDLSRPLHTVPELMSADTLLLEMFEKKEQICAVVDEHGGLAGIITLEDILEEVVGKEIIDEYDAVSDLRTFAKILRVVRNRKSSK
ncbi:MAG: HlyC/CorC family transporter [Bdellovibrionales bacterium]|nr:HlyC/CorC family transporter [Bdellovibrionales bacterium]